jgi:NAD(P)H-dependent FMN reductase
LIENLGNYVSLQTDMKKVKAIIELENMKKILFVIGSLRAKSFNRQVAEVAKEVIGSRAEVQELEYGDLPLLNQDIEQPELEVVARIRKAVSEADALWIFTPEYNMSYPGHLKNLLDWLSRPVKFMDYGTPTCVNGKRVALTGAGGKAATADCRAKLTELLTFMKAEVLPEQVGIAVPAEAWGTDVLVLTEEQKAQLKELAGKMCDV